MHPFTIILFLTVNLLVLLVLGGPQLLARFGLTGNPILTPTDQSATVGFLATATPLPPTAVPPPPSPTQEPPLPVEESDLGLWERSVILLALQEGLDTHLFAYQPVARDAQAALPLTRLTHGAWDDITPAFDPHGKSLAFASNRNGYWDLYQLDLAAGDVTPITDTPEFEASPSWSPDGLWVALERYAEDNLDIFILPVDGSQPPVQLTRHSAADFSPAWSPTGRQIAFISTRGGRGQVWVANLDETGPARFTLLSGPDEIRAARPAWSPDGQILAWTAVNGDGLHQVYLWDSTRPEASPRLWGSGDWVTWSPDGEVLLVVLQTPTTSYLTAYTRQERGQVVLPPLPLPAPVAGLAWLDFDFSQVLAWLEPSGPTPVWQMDREVAPSSHSGRWSLAELEEVEAPYPFLHQQVYQAFQAFRDQLAVEVGWDLLSELENAYVPLTGALPPGREKDWLYTGRAFAFNTLPVNAGWMAVVREDFGPQTFWRVYLRARFQDGSQGMPLHDVPWDFDARYRGNPLIYDQGGAYAEAVPAGYWVDMTRLAAFFGWERLPALANWRASYPSARFNEFVNTGGLDWESAMLQIYPPEALLTPTSIPSPTPTLTPSPRWYRSPTPSPTVTGTPTPTPTATEPAPLP